MRRFLYSGIGALCLVALGIFLYSNLDTKNVSFTSSSTGISFIYPGTYHLEEKNTGTGERSRFTIVLMEDTEENKAVRDGTAPPREGPVTITIDAFQNNLDSYTAESWIRGTNDSNYKLSPDGVIEETAISGEKALKYRWSGLYEGETYALAQGDWIFALSVTYMSKEDLIRTDFQKILDTVTFQ